MLLGYSDETIQEVYVPIPSMAVVEYMTKGSQSTSKDGSRLLAHIASLRVLIKSKAHSAIIWEEDLLTPICRFPSLSKRLFAQTASDLIVLYPGGGDEDYSNDEDADDNLDTLNHRKLSTGNLAIRAYWISRDYAFRCLAIFDRPFYSIALSPLSIDRFLDVGDHVTIVAPSLFYLKDRRP